MNHNVERAALQATISSATATPREGEIVEFVATLANTGDTAVEHVHLNVTGPSMGYLLDVAELPRAKVDHDARSAEASVSVPAHGEVRFQVRTLAPRGSAGNTLGITLHAAHYPSSTDLWEHATLTIDRRVSVEGDRAGAWHVTGAGFAVLGWLVASLAVWGMIAWLTRRDKASGSSAGGKGSSPLPRAGSLGIAAALMIPCGFWLVFAGMAWRDYRAMIHWREARATVLGRRVAVQSESSATPRRGSHDRGDVTTYSPEFALRYEAAGQTIVSTGYDTGSSLRVGGRVTRERELDEWRVGAEIPCWYDPDHPEDVVVRRGFGGAYLFALVPIPVFWIGLTLLRHRIPARRHREEMLDETGGAGKPR